MATCYKLISCHPNYYPNIDLISHPDLDLVYNTDPNSIVTLNGDAGRGYTLEAYKVASWLPIPNDAEFIAPGNFTTITLENFVINGVEYVTSPLQYGGFANPGPISYLDILNDFSNANGLDLTFGLDLSGKIAVVTTIGVVIYIQATQGSSAGTIDDGTYSYGYDGALGSSYDFDGTVSTVLPETEVVDTDCNQCGDITSVQSVTVCPNVNPFYANLLDENSEISISEIPGCLGLNIVDGTVYSNNTDGHGLANFSDYIRIEITRGDNSLYIMSSIAGDDVDEIIQAPDVAIAGYYPYYFQDSDVDGIYNTLLEVYPTWNSLVSYTTTELTVVYRSGSLYKLLTNDTGSDPALNPAIWELYEATTEEVLLTRYATQQKIVVLCIKINDCEEKLIHAAFCLIDSDFCNDNVLCSNPKFLNANKYLILKRALEISVNKSAWNEVEKQLNALKSICC